MHASWNKELVDSEQIREALPAPNVPPCDLPPLLAVLGGEAALAMHGYWATLASVVSDYSLWSVCCQPISSCSPLGVLAQSGLMRCSVCPVKFFPPLMAACPSSFFFGRTLLLPCDWMQCTLSSFFSTLCFWIPAPSTMCTIASPIHRLTCHGFFLQRLTINAVTSSAASWCPMTQHQCLLKELDGQKYIFLITFTQNVIDQQKHVGTGPSKGSE